MASGNEKHELSGDTELNNVQGSAKRFKNSDSDAPRKCKRNGCIEGYQKRNGEIVSFKDGKNECDQCRKGRSTSVKKFNDKNNPKANAKVCPVSPISNQHSHRN